MYKIHLLPASFGDALLIAYGDRNSPHYILIDGGPVNNFEEFYAALRNVAPDLEELELLVVTHIDIDHIDGILKLLNQSGSGISVNQIWFNGHEQLLKASNLLDQLGAVQGELLGQLIHRDGLAQNEDFENGIAAIYADGSLPMITTQGGMNITLLAPGLEELKKLLPKWDEELEDKGDVDLDSDSRYDDDLLGDWILTASEMPEKKDTSHANKSSIAFIAEYEGESCLFAGDTPGALLLEGIETLLMSTGEELLKVDAWKLAHHGSHASTSLSLIEKIQAKHLLVSSDGKRYKHPDTWPLANILVHNNAERSVKIHFNYRTQYTSRWDDNEMKTKYKYSVKYGNENGITVLI